MNPDALKRLVRELPQHGGRQLAILGENLAGRGHIERSIRREF